MSSYKQRLQLFWCQETEVLKQIKSFWDVIRLKTKSQVYNSVCSVQVIWDRSILVLLKFMYWIYTSTSCKSINTSPGHWEEVKAKSNVTSKVKMSWVFQSSSLLLLKVLAFTRCKSISHLNTRLSGAWIRHNWCSNLKFKSVEVQVFSPSGRVNLKPIRASLISLRTDRCC